MFSKFNLIEIFKDGFTEISISKKKFVFFSFHLVLPFFIFLSFFFYFSCLDKDIISNIISSISIFSGLLFSVIFILLDNYHKRKNKLKLNKSDEYVNYVERYKNFTSKITTLILFSISLSILIIISLIIFLSISNNCIFNSKIQSIKIKMIFSLLQSFSSVLLFNYFLVVIHLIKKIYAMIYDSINSKF